jgi:hypothetical protein
MSDRTRGIGITPDAARHAEILADALAALVAKRSD